MKFHGLQKRFTNHSLQTKNMKKILFFVAIFWGITINTIATIRYVKQVPSGNISGSSWANANNDLQAMINASVSGDEIWVAAGTYRPSSYPAGCSGCSSTRDYTFLLKEGVKIYGQFVGTESTLSQRVLGVNESILTADVDNDIIVSNNAFHVVTSLNCTGATVLDGFTIKDGNATDNTTITVSTRTYYRYWGGGMICIFSSPTIRNCSFINNYADSGGGILSSNSSSPNISNSIFATNIAGGGGAIYNHDFSSPTIANCTIASNNGLAAGGAIYNYNGSNPTITGCIIWSNTSPSLPGIANNGGTPVVSFSIVQSGNTPCTTCPNTNGNIDPQFVNIADPNGADNKWGTADDGLQLNTCSPAIEQGGASYILSTLDISGRPRQFNIPFRNNPNYGPLGAESFLDIGAYENQSTTPLRKYVNALLATGANNGTSWANAFRSSTTALQDAVNSLSSSTCEGNEIWVAAGTYKPSAYPTGCTGCSSNRDFTFLLLNGVKMYGGFAGTETNISQRNSENPSILSGDIGVESVETDNVYHVMIANNSTSNTLLDGFVITNGGTSDNLPDAEKITLAGNEFRRNFGGGLAMINSSNIVSNCTFLNNSGYFGGAMHISTNNAITQTPIVSTCSFSSNFSPSGAGIFTSGANTLITKCNFSNNNSSFYGGGITVGNGLVQVEKSIFQLNYAVNSGGAIFNSGNTTTQNCLFITNQSNFGAAIANSGASTPNILNCTFTGNTGVNDIGINNYNSNPTIRNSIIWNTTPSALAAILNTGTSVSTVSNSIVQGGYTGCASCPSTNGNVNPLFTNATDTNGLDNKYCTIDDGLTLQYTSPAVNAGTNTGTPNDDIIGNSKDGNRDIGAYEFMSKSNCTEKYLSDVPIEAGTHYSINKITSNGTVGSGTNVIFDAERSISLLPGFVTQNTAVFKAQIGGCSGFTAEKIRN